MDWERRQSVIGDFIKLLSKYPLTGFGVGIDAKYWRHLSTERRKKFGDAQLFAVQRIMRIVTDRLHHSHINEPIELCFDHDIEFSRRRLKLFDDVKKQYQSAQDFAAISFGDSERIIPLQAADLLVGETRTHLLRRAAKKDITPRYRQLMDAFAERDLAYAGEFWDEKTTEEELSKIEKLIESDRRDTASRRQSS
jgi:Protein of unknown function (DUF3800)